MSIFNYVPSSRIRHTRHNLSFGNRLSGRFGYLYPVLSRKIVPGDRFTFQSQQFSQFATMATKVYQDFVLKQETFFVPSRLLWDNFDKFYSLDTESDSYIHPYFNYASLVKVGAMRHGSLYDYFNLPTFWYPVPEGDWKYSEKDRYDWQQHTDDFRRITSIVEDEFNSVYRLDPLRFFAFLKIYCEYYVNENICSDFVDLSTSTHIPLNDWESIYKFFCQYIVDHNGNVTDLVQDIAQMWQYGTLNRNYPKDYFTSCLPFAQKGPQVNIPFTGTGYAEFFADKESYDSVEAQAMRGVRTFTDGHMIDETKERVQFTATGASTSGNVLSDYGAKNAAISNRVLFQNGLTSIENLRTAVILQEFYEKNARSGTRFKETLLAHFNVNNKDSRLQRAQFIQGVSTDLNMGNVYSTSANEDGTAITGEPVSVINGAGLSGRRKFRSTEPGYILSFISVYPRASYYKGINREWMELDKFDYYWPSFQHLGEQGVKIAELSVGNNYNGGQSDDEELGYNPRNAHYKISLNEIHGDFRDSRKAMTAARDFLPPVALNENFIRIDAKYNNLNRVFNYTGDDYDKFDIDVFQKIIASRPMDYFGIPRFF